MNNYNFNTTDIEKAFKKLNIKKNDKLFVTTSLGMLGRLDTKKILIAWVFYSLFHFLTIYVGILFSMNFLAWLIILPVYRWSFKNDKK